VSHTRVGEQMNAPDGNELRVRTGQAGPAVSRPFRAGPDLECVAAPADPNEHATSIPVGRWGHDQLDRASVTTAPTDGYPSANSTPALTHRSEETRRRIPGLVELVGEGSGELDLHCTVLGEGGEKGMLAVVQETP
jgi:hypothetical protein